jgi:hypothetical protein
MVEDQREPDWLRHLRAQQQTEQPDAGQDLWDQTDQTDRLEGQPEPARLARAREQQPGEQPRVTQDLRGQTDQADMLEDLREQMIQAEGELEYERRASLAQAFTNLEPWQRLVLAVLLFLNVALCGCMALVMAGRVMLPF